MKQTKRIWGELHIKSGTVYEVLCSSLVTVHNITARLITVTHSALVPNINTTFLYFFPHSLCNKVCYTVSDILFDLAFTPSPTLSKALVFNMAVSLQDREEGQSISF